MTFTDSDGRTWDVIDWRMVDGKRKRVPLGDGHAEGRAFVCGSDVRLYPFGAFAYRTTEPKILSEQFRLAKPLDAKPAESWGKSHV